MLMLSQINGYYCSNIYAIYGYQGDQSGTPLIGMEAIYISTTGTGTAFPFSGTLGAICYPKYLSNGNIFALGIFSSRIIAVNLDNSNPITSIICCSVLKYFFNTIQNFNAKANELYGDIDSSETYFYAVASGPDSNIYIFQATVKDLVLQCASMITLTDHGSYIRVKFNSCINSNLYVAVLVGTTVNIFNLGLNAGNAGFKILYQKQITGVLNATPLSATTDYLLLGTSRIGVTKSTFTNTQTIIYKSSNSLKFLDYSCYEINDATSYAISQFPTSDTVLTIASFFTFPATTTYYSMSNSFLVDSTAYSLSSQATMNQDSTSIPCSVCPVNMLYTDTNVLVQSTAGSMQISSQASQCQNIGFTTQLTSVDGSSSYPSWVTYDSSSNLITLNPSLITTLSGLKAYPFVLSATDKSLVPATTTKTFNVNMYNNPPKISSTITDQSVTAFYSITIQRTISDSDGGDTVSYDFSCTSSTMPSSMTNSYSAVSQQFSVSWTPTNSDVGTLTFSLKYWDYFRTSSKLENTFKIIVSQNLPPVFKSSLQDQSAKECVTKYYSIPQYYDVLGETVTVSCVNCLTIDSSQSWLIFSASLGKFTISPPYVSLNTGTVTYSPQLQLTDQFSISVTNSFTITITKNNRPVILTIPDMSVTAMTTLSLNLSSKYSDSDSTTLSLSLAYDGSTSLPSWLYLEGTSLVVKDAPLSETNKFHKIKLMVVDECTSLPVSSNEFALIITQNYPPTLTGSLSSLTIYKGQGSINVPLPSGLFNDPENSYSITASSSSSLISSITANNTNIVFQCFSDKIGSFSITVLCTDHAGQTVSTSMPVTIKDCIQSNCKGCNGETETSCLTCNNGYTLNSFKICEFSGTNNYLQKDVTASNFIPSSVASGIIISATVVTSLATNVSPVSSALIVSQMQSTSCIAMFNINTPDNMVSYSKSLNIQSTLKLPTSRRLLNTAYVSLARLGYYDATFLQNQLLFIIVVCLIIAIHIIAIIFRDCLKRPKCMLNFFNWVLDCFEFGVYVYLFIYTSQIIFIVCFADIFRFSFDTAIDAISFIVAILFGIVPTFVFIISIIYYEIK